jgi:hypothetical protein
MASSAKSETRQYDIPGPLSKLFFGYVSPIIRTARARGCLDLVDIPVHVQLATVDLFQRFKAAWSERKSKKTMDVIMSICAGRWLTIFLTGLGYITSAGSTLAGPLLLGRIVQGLACRGLPGCQSEKTTYMCAYLPQASLLHVSALRGHSFRIVAQHAAGMAGMDRGHSFRIVAQHAEAPGSRHKEHSYPTYVGIHRDHSGSIQVRAVCVKVMCATHREEPQPRRSREGPCELHRSQALETFFASCDVLSRLRSLRTPASLAEMWHASYQSYQKKLSKSHQSGILIETIAWDSIRWQL